MLSLTHKLQSINLTDNTCMWITHACCQIPIMLISAVNQITQVKPALAGGPWPSWGFHLWLLSNCEKHRSLQEQEMSTWIDSSKSVTLACHFSVVLKLCWTTSLFRPICYLLFKPDESQVYRDVHILDCRVGSFCVTSIFFLVLILHFDIIVCYCSDFKYNWQNKFISYLLHIVFDYFKR